MYAVELNGPHLAYNIVKCISTKKNVWIWVII